MNEWIKRCAHWCKTWIKRALVSHLLFILSTKSKKCTRLNIFMFNRSNKCSLLRQNRKSISFFFSRSGYLGILFYRFFVSVRKLWICLLNLMGHGDLRWHCMWTVNFCGNLLCKMYLDFMLLKFPLKQRCRNRPSRDTSMPTISISWRH